jgi:hypothetical protein
LFQGYFFCRPQLVRGPRLDANRLSLLALLAALQDPAAQLADLEGMIARDLRVSYRLLGYIKLRVLRAAPARPVDRAGARAARPGESSNAGRRWACLPASTTNRPS